MQNGVFTEVGTARLTKFLSSEDGKVVDGIYNWESPRNSASEAIGTREILKCSFAFNNVRIPLYGSHQEFQFNSASLYCLVCPESPNMTSVYAFPSTDKLSEALDQHVEKLSAEAIKKHGRFTVAVSGGSLPKLLSANLKKNPRIDFINWHIFFADERCVLLDPLAEQIPPGAVHTIQPELSPEEAAEEYMDQLMAVFAAGDAVKFPVFDLILLGMGNASYEKNDPTRTTAANLLATY
jgi:hypothetical protein